MVSTTTVLPSKDSTNAWNRSSTCTNVLAIPITPSSSKTAGEADMQTVAESDVEPTCIYDSLNEMRKYL